MVQASTVSESAETGDRLRYIASCQNVYSRLVEGHDAGVSVFKVPLRVDIHASGEGIEPLLAKLGTYALVGG
jgi:hypothetical protein